jgi:TRAP transporter 4TM/12TM fusion protein
MATSQNKLRLTLLTVLGGAWLVFQLYILFSPQLPMVQRPLHLIFALAIFLLAPSRKGSPSSRGIIDGLLVLGVLAVMGYYFFSWQRLSGRMEAVDPILMIDIVFGLLLVGIMLECVRRAVGWSLLGVILVFLAFGFLGRIIPAWTSFTWVPELMKFSGFTLGDAVENFTMTPNGLLGVTTSTSMTFVFYFVMFGAVYSAIGGGQLFIDIGLRLAGKQRGGAAKAAVISSSLMGSISGSAVANVATTGLFTIPLMRRAGYQASMAAAVEAIASTGGQLMPPIMGVAAFVMAELLQEQYSTIALAGVIPALAFYWSLLLVVDLHARRTNLQTVPADPREGQSSISRRLYLLTPLAVLIGLLVYGLAANLCAVIAMATCLVIGLAQRSNSLKDWLSVLLKATRQAAEVAIPIAAIGLIIEVAVQSSLVLKFSVHLIELGGGTMVGALFWIVIGCIIMGMGLPTVAAYIIGATLFVPALLDLGLEKLPAHFFVMYYCVLSMVTPPVALASYTAAGLAEAPVTKTCLSALRLSLVGFVIPFAFVFNPAILGQGSAGAITLSVLCLLIGTTIWAVAVEGYFWGNHLTLIPRWMIGLAALAILFIPFLTSRS